MKLVMRQVRERNGWSQSYVTCALGLKKSAYAMIELRQRKPSYEVLVKLEDLFGMTHRELFAEATADEGGTMLAMGHERIRRGWSRKQVGACVGVTEEAVRLMEVGQRKPGYEVLVKLEDLFGMSHRELFSEVERHTEL